MKNPLFFPCFILLLAISLVPLVKPAYAQEKFLLNCKVNDQPVRFVYDTGASGSVLFRKTAERLGLKITPRPANAPPLRRGQVPLDHTEECTLAIGTFMEKCTFGVLDFISDPENKSDGVFSWAELNSNDRVILIDAEKMTFSVINLPADIEKWTKWKIGESNVLELERGEGKETVRIGIDTGDYSGVKLNPAQWEKWRGERKALPATLNVEWSPVDGMVVNDVLRVRKITFGDLTLNDVPVMGANPAANISYKQCDAILGLFALTRMKLIIDRKNGVVYTLPNTNPPLPFAYNRLGAIFMVNTPNKPDDSVALVMRGSPADEAGIRSGDILLKVDGNDVTKWRTDPTQLSQKLWFQEPGTQLKLLLKQNGVQREVTVTLKEPTPVD